MHILGINVSHDTSIGLIKDGKIDLYQEEKKLLNLDAYDPINISCELITKQQRKFFNNFIGSNEVIPKSLGFQLKCIDAYIKEKPDLVIYSSYDRTLPDETNYGDTVLIEELQKQLNYPKYLFFKKNHHIYHAFNAFHLSNFDDALCIVLDGGGAQIATSFQEIESIFYLNRNEYKYFYQHLSNNRFLIIDDIIKLNSRIYEKINGVETEMSSETSSGMKFSELAEEIRLEKKYSNEISMNFIIKEMMQLYHLGNENGNRLEDAIKKLHIETKNETIKFIEKALSYHKTKNIILSGGYALNHINNAEYKKHFSDYNFFFDPWAHDGGTAPGAALWLDFHLNKLNIPFEELEKRQNEVFA